MSITCPACGFLTISEDEYGSYEICEICGWEDDCVQLANPACEGGANLLSLIQAQRQVLEQYPLDIKLVKNTERDPQWRPLDDSEVLRVESERKDGYFTNKAVYSPDECYWQKKA